MLEHVNLAGPETDLIRLVRSSWLGGGLFEQNSASPLQAQVDGLQLYIDELVQLPLTGLFIACLMLHDVKLQSNIGLTRWFSSVIATIPNIRESLSN